MRALARRWCARDDVVLDFTSTTVDLIRANRVIRIAAKHWIYAQSIAANFDTYFGQVVPTTEVGSLVVDYSAPRLQTYRSSGLQFEISSLPEEDSAIQDYFRWYRPKEGDVVFDLGAYCGVSTYAFSKAVGVSGHVYSFEPDTTSHALLLRNIDRHGLRNVTPLRLAIAATSGEATFNHEGALGSVLADDSSRATTGNTTTVETITLEAACERFGFPAFVKIDIEGSEIPVLHAARDFLSANDIQFALDTNHWVNGVRTTDQVEQIFGAYGYETMSSDDSGFWTTWARRV